MTEATTTLDYATDGQPSHCMSHAAHRRIGCAFLALAVIDLVFSAWWGRQLEWNHVLAFHGCACGKLSAENLAGFSALPLVAALTVHGTRRTGIRFAITGALICLVATCAVCGELWAVYFGWTRTHLFT